MKKILGIDVGGTYTRFGISNKGVVSNVKKVYTKDIKDFVSFVITESKKTIGLEAISIGVPGIVCHNKVVSIPNIENVNIKDLDTKIKTNTGLDVYINRDVNLLFINDLTRLNLREHKHVIGIYLGTGLGNALLINGSLIQGSHGFAGELGHIPIIGNQKQCNCGKIGCAETIVSGLALVEIHKIYKLTGELKDAFKMHLNHKAIQEFIYHFALIIATEINILDITTIIIGGGVVNMDSFPKAKVKELIKSKLRSQILESELKVFFVDDSPVNSIIGASLIVEE